MWFDVKKKRKAGQRGGGQKSWQIMVPGSYRGFLGYSLLDLRCDQAKGQLRCRAFTGEQETSRSEAEVWFSDFFPFFSSPPQHNTSDVCVFLEAASVLVWVPAAIFFLRLCFEFAVHDLTLPERPHLKTASHKDNIEGPSWKKQPKYALIMCSEYSHVVRGFIFLCRAIKWVTEENKVQLAGWQEMISLLKLILALDSQEQCCKLC